MAAFTPLTADQMLEKGLRLLGVTMEEQARRLQKTNMEDFEAHFGSNPTVISKIWSLLHTRNNAPLTPGKHFALDYLIALHWLRVYPTEREQKISLKIGEKTGRKWSWFYSQQIASPTQR